MSPDATLRALGWVAALLGGQLLLLLALGAWLQVRRKWWNSRRIACHQAWESQIVDYLYGEGRPTAPFEALGRWERKRLVPFLLRVMGTLAGTEGRAVRELYQHLELHSGLGRRLGSRRPRLRALAALEVGSFQVEAHYPRLLTLLEDPVPYVAYTAARGLSGTRRMDYAAPVLEWVLRQDSYRQDRLLWILEGFGPEFLPWLQARMAGGGPDGRLQLIFALLAASTRQVNDPAPLTALLAAEDLEVRAAALKALGGLGDPSALPAVAPFAEHPEWVLRAQAARAIGALAGPGAVPTLLGLVGDPVFDVRRNAAQALFRLGPAGLEALAWLRDDVSADPFARDLARERLQWREPPPSGSEGS